MSVWRSLRGWEGEKLLCTHSEPHGCWWCSLMALQSWLQHCLPEQNDIVCTPSLSPYSSSSSSRRLLPLLFFARLLAAQTAQLSSVPPLPQQILHELCVSEWDGTFKGECSLQGQCVCTSSVCPPPLLPVLLCTPFQTLLRFISVKDSSPEAPPPHAHITLHPLLFIFTLQQKLLWDTSVLIPLWGTVCSIEGPLVWFKTSPCLWNFIWKYLEGFLLVCVTEAY